MENARDIRTRLLKIKEEIESGNISHERRNLLLEEAKKLITVENIDCQREIIEKMIDEKYPQSKIWEHCQNEIELIDFSLNETNELKKRATSINPSFIDSDLKKEVKKINSHLNHLMRLKRALKQYQVHYCKDYPQKPSSEEDITQLNKKKKKGGRPLSDNADQEKIVSTVRGLIDAGSGYCQATERKKEFINSNGKPKPTALSEYILNNHPELSGLSDRQTFERVKMAISEICDN